MNNYWLTKHELKQNRYSGVVLIGDKVNKNNRIYPKSVLEKVVEDKQESIRNRSWICPIDLTSTGVLQLSQASHVITKLEMSGSAMVAEIEFLPTPSGNLLKQMIDSGTKMTLRTLGIGSGRINEDIHLVVGNDYRLEYICLILAENAA